VNLLNQAIDICGHDEQVASGIGRWIPVGVRCPAWNEDSRSRIRFDDFAADLYVECALQDVPSFIIPVMDVERSDESRRSGRTAIGTPLGDNEVISDGTHHLTGKWR
jgi:hypothetical protein